MELDVSLIVLSIGSAFRKPLPSTGSLGLVPPLRRYYEPLGRPPPFACCRADCARCRASFPSLGATTETVEAADSPRFLGNPHARAVFFDPDRIASQAIRDMPYSSARRCCLPSPLRRRLLPLLALRGSIARLVRSLSTLRRPGRPRSRRKTRFRLVAHLGRSGFQPAGFHREVSMVFSTSRSPHPGFPGAQRPARERSGGMRASFRGLRASVRALTSSGRAAASPHACFACGDRDLTSRDLGVRRRSPSARRGRPISTPAATCSTSMSEQ
jgi:hypothetical protein